MQPYSLSRRNFLAAAAAAAAGLALKPALGESEDLAALTLKQASVLLRRGAASPVDLTRACLERIERHNPALNAFITVTGEQALEDARRMEAEQRRGKWRGPLHGIPIALKDNIDTAGIRTTAASQLFKDRVPPKDAEVVRRLKDAGAVMLGKLNLQEFAYGGTSTVSYFGAVHNPWALDHIAGGSSGGSAAAVAAKLCYGSLGTDTAGSVRIPASYCGVVGFKPTYGRVSLRGVIPLAWSLDHLGPIGRTVEDAALLLGVVAGYDQLDPATVNVPAQDYASALGRETAGLRLGIPRSPFYENLDPRVADAVEEATGALRKITRSVTETKLPPAAPILPIVGAEAYAYQSQWITKSPGLYQPFTRNRIELAAAVKAPAYAEALRQTNLQRRQIAELFSSVDLLITPTMHGVAETFAQSANFDPMGIRNTSPFDIFGLPTISVPCGFTTSGLPIGLQITGAPFAESTVLVLGHAYERATAWHERRPPLRPA
ncbi:MAG TPA: amidase [Candidatus Acidoferrales bacterium]|nr:amidase [Candidatus Acidoferrales bacterium]